MQGSYPLLKAFLPGAAGERVLVGSPGVGKTHIAVALGVEAVRARKLTYFVACQRLVGDLKRVAEKGALECRMRFYSHPSLLIVDEVGYLDVDKEGADLPLQLISRRYERRSTTVTTNVGIGAWAKVFGDPVVANAIADRLRHHCTVLKITGRSYRTKTSRRTGTPETAPDVGGLLRAIAVLSASSASPVTYNFLRSRRISAYVRLRTAGRAPRSRTHKPTTRYSP